MPVATIAPPENRVLLHNITWETYERLLAEHTESCGTRFTYDEGELEIMVVSASHEKPNRTLAHIAEITAEMTGRDLSALGSSTFKRKDLGKAFEPDSCFYFRHARAVRDKDELDLSTDPPPELIIEVDMSRSSLNRFPIFAAIGVEEIWRYDGERVWFHALEANTYRLIEESIVLSPMTAKQATILVEAGRHEDWIDWLRAVREWVRAHS